MNKLNETLKMPYQISLNFSKEEVQFGQDCGAGLGRRGVALLRFLCPFQM